MTNDPSDDLKQLAGAARAEFEAAAVMPAVTEDATLEQPGDIVGRYTLIERLGEGGMGTVWRADQEQPVRRKVALKVIRLGQETPEVLARFHQEQRTLALMEHPNIAAVLDGGRTPKGRPYFVMEYIDGVPLTDYCQDHRLGLSERLELFAQVANAIEHAHQKGVIHRDIKPSNVLVQRVDGEPFPKVIDFGIAMAVEEDEAHTRWTQARAPIGTLAYMSPEQAGVVDQDVDTRTDVYGLGALLYQLVTSDVPLRSATGTGSELEVALRSLREVDPERPSVRLTQAAGRGAAAAEQLGMPWARLKRVLAQDLDWIILKALEKDRGRRYPSATALGADLRRFLDGEPIEARPPSWKYRATKFVRRNRLAVAAAAAIFLISVAGAVGTGYGLVRSLSANRDLEEANQVAGRELARATESRELLSSLLTSVAPRVARGKDTALLLGILDRASVRLDAGEISDPEVACGLDYDIGQSYRALGRLEEGLRHVRRARISAAQLRGEASPLALRMLTSEATALRSLERIEESEEAFRAALSKLQAIHRADHPDVTRAQIGLGTLLHRSGRLDDAEALLTEAVELERAALTERARAESPGLVALATLKFFDRQDIGAAKELFEEALVLVERHLGEDDPQALRALEHLSQIDAFTGAMDAAVDRGEALLTRFERVYGPDHRETLGAQGNHAVTLFRAGRADESDPLIRRVLEAQERVLPKDDPDTLWTEMQVAIHDATKGGHEVAIGRLRRLIDVKKAQGAPPIEEAVNLGIMLRDLGREDEALEVLGDIRRVAESLIGPEHPTTQMIVELIEGAPPGPGGE